MPFSEGENVGPYRVMEKLGQGGMATVYKAYHANLDRYVALKVLHPAFLEDENFLARFQREARLVAKLEHPNIVPIYDFAEHEGQPYLVMKFVEGETLKAYLSRGRLDVEQIWGVVNAVGAGLAYAHKQGILHRDIKPSNVIVTPDGQMYLADFGLARIAERGESTLSGDMIMGTPQYISPEQAMGAKDLDEGTDIYSFAVMLYEMVVGQVPFSSDTPFSVIHDHIYSPLPMPKMINPSVPDEVERVLLKALAKERQDRYPDVPALVAAFKQAWEEANVDMAEVTMTAPIRREPATIPATPQAEGTPASTRVASDAATTPQTEASPPSTSEAVKSLAAESSKKKKRLGWALAATGVLIVLACLFGVSVLRNVKSLRDTVALEVLDEEPLAPLPPEAVDDPQELQDLRTWVEEAPGDPYAHLAFALALFDNKRFDPAYDELRLGLERAGDNVDFYYEAGFNLMDREAWTAATVVFIRTLQNIPPSAPETAEFIGFFHESLYKAAAAPEAFDFIPTEDAMRLDEPMMRVAEARHIFYHGDPTKAWQVLDELQQAKPGMPEARLLEAEMHLRDGHRDQAQALFESLMNDDNTPDWIFFIAEEAISKMP